MLALLVAAGSQPAFSQDQAFSRYDSLRGALNPYRTCYDVHFYDLTVQVFPDEQRIQGKNAIHFTAKRTFDTLQVDLFANMAIDSITHQNQQLTYNRDSNFVFVAFPSAVPEGAEERFTVHYRGMPREAPKPPWDGGFDWDSDKKGRHHIGVACEGTGASLWWPNKDHLTEEPDSMAITGIVPEELTLVSNGQLRGKAPRPEGFQAYHWFVSYPINNYNVTLNIGHYAHFQRQYQSPLTASSLPLDYYVLDYNLPEAKAHFEQVPGILKCFERYFGPYPFPEDGYALVETPYWGMEHQGAIAYGNDYQNRPRGFDYIILHETGHEWWGNSVSTHDHGAMWIHESFTTYMEALYIECRYDYQEAVSYLKQQRRRIRNQHPVMGPLEVNYTSWPASDMYYKGSWMLHTLRNSINDDSTWFQILGGLTDTFRQTVVNSQDIIGYINEHTERDYRPFFRQYLHYTDPPVFEYKIQEGNERQKQLVYRWSADVKDYSMPVTVQINGQTHRLSPTQAWQELPVQEPVEVVKPNRENFYITVKQLSETPSDP
jgi:aminopeptidase N